MRRGLAALALAGLAVSCSQPPPPVVPEEKHSFEARLPPGFPSDLPLPEGATVLASLYSKQAMVVFFDAPRPSIETRDFFAAHLPEAGWVVLGCQTLPATPEPVAFFIAGKGGLVASVNVGMTMTPEVGPLERVKRYSFYVSVAESVAPLPSQQPPASCA